MAGIYIHIPFCKTRCIYCDFYSTTRSELKQQYIRALCTELKTRKGYLKEEPIETIYFGGGTPSQLAHEDFEQIFRTIKRSWKRRADHQHAHWFFHGLCNRRGRSDLALFWRARAGKCPQGGADDHCADDHSERGAECGRRLDDAFDAACDADAGRCDCAGGGISAHLLCGSERPAAL